LNSSEEATFRLAAKAIVADFPALHDDADLDQLALQIAVLAMVAISRPPFAPKKVDG
jgi:hypothetical protein